MKTILLSNSDALVYVSDEDYIRVSLYNWFIRRNGYVQGNKTLLHRFILNAPDGCDVDHINRCRLDNRRENLRICTHSENCQNKGSWGSSGSKYIYFKTKSKLWSVQIPFNGSVKSVGYSKSKDEAIILRDNFLRSHKLDSKINYLGT